MSLVTIGIIGIVIMLALMFLKMPVGVAMIMVGFAGLCCVTGFQPGISSFAMAAYRAATDYILTVIPLFIVMGILAAEGGLSTDAFYAANKWLGRLSGGLAMAAVSGCAAFGAVCGDSIATAITMSQVSLPEMRKYGYNDQLSLGTLASGGLLGFMIPPSIPFILYAVLTEISVGSLFIAGVFPGLLVTLLFMAAIYIVCRLNPSMGPLGPKISWKEKFGAVYRVWGILLLFILVMGGLYGGFFTPSEAGAVGAFGALVLSLAKRRLTWKSFTRALSSAGQLTGMIFLLIIGATVFNHFLAITEISLHLASWIGSLTVPSVVIVLAILMMYLVFGCFIDIIAVMMITVPIFFPIIVARGIDPVWLGVLIVLMMMIGQITPPVGIAVYAVSGLVKDVPMYTIFRGVLPFVFAMVIAMIILVIFPEISLILPSYMRPA